MPTLDDFLTFLRGIAVWHFGLFDSAQTPSHGTSMPLQNSTTGNVTNVPSWLYLTIIFLVLFSILRVIDRAVFRSTLRRLKIL